MTRLPSGSFACQSFVLLLVIVAAGCNRSIEPSSSSPRNQIEAPEPVAGAEIQQTGASAKAAGGAAGDKPSATVESPQMPAKDTPKAAKREPIYVEEANGATLIAAALAQARAGEKRVLIEWGGNWCGWCYKLHDVFTKDAAVRPILADKYVLVLIDVEPNRELMEKYGGKDRRYSYPHLTVLDADGNVLVNQNTEPLEDGPKHDPAKVAAFLAKWASAHKQTGE